jgi:hypothetical protein
LLEPPITEAIVEDWWIEYNTVRPHSALGLSDSADDYAKAWTAHPEFP